MSCQALQTLKLSEGTWGAKPAAGVSRGHRLPVSPALGLQVLPAVCIPMPKTSAWKIHISPLLVFCFV